jgi:hypothetical protein
MPAYYASSFAKASEDKKASKAAASHGKGMIHSQI